MAPNGLDGAFFAACVDLSGYLRPSIPDIGQVLYRVSGQLLVCLDLAPSAIFSVFLIKQFPVTDTTILVTDQNAVPAADVIGKAYFHPAL